MRACVVIVSGLFCTGTRARMLVLCHARHSPHTRVCSQTGACCIMLGWRACMRRDCEWVVRHAALYEHVSATPYLHCRSRPTS